ncbi:MAG: hypothetical protein ABIR30_09790 [Chitinophagaceae bacterium]
MTIAFTLCSNNFLAQAKTLADSLQHYHPEMKIFLFLVDEKNASVDYSALPAEIIAVNEEVVPGYAALVNRYSILELNSNLKPFLFDWLVSRHPGITKIYYLDADTCLYGRMDHVNALLEKEDIVVAPHFLSPVPTDGTEPFENLALNYGTYNLGFLALNPSSRNARNFLKWWGERTGEFGNNDVANGFFVDQLWMNLAPVFFEKVHTLRHKGYNMAPWNLHERVISSYEEGKIFLVSGEQLVHYHFSSFDPFKPEQVSAKYGRRNFINTPGLKKLYTDYSRRLQENRVGEFSKIGCALPLKRTKRVGPLRRMLYPVKVLLRSSWKRT